MVFSIMSEDSDNDTNQPPRHNHLYENAKLRLNDADTRTPGRRRRNDQVQLRVNSNGKSIQEAPPPPHSPPYLREGSTTDVTQQRNQLYVNQGNTSIVTPPPPHSQLYVNEGSIQDTKTHLYANQICTKNNRTKLTSPNSQPSASENNSPNNRPKLGLLPPNSQASASENSSPNNRPKLLPPNNQPSASENSSPNNRPKLLPPNSQASASENRTLNNRPKLLPPNSQSFANENSSPNNRPKLLPPNSQASASEGKTLNNRPKLLLPNTSSIQEAPPPPHISSSSRERSTLEDIQQLNQLYVNKRKTPPPPHRRLYVNEPSIQGITSQPNSHINVKKNGTQNDRPKLQLPNNQLYPREETTPNIQPRFSQPVLITTNNRCADSVRFSCNIYERHRTASTPPNPSVYAKDPISKKPAMAKSQSAPDPEVESYMWFSGDLNREEAQTKLMQRSRDGMYVVRHSSHGDQPYCLSVYYNSKVYHIKIRQENNMFLLGEKRQSEGSFSCVADLIQHYQKHPILLKHDRSQQTVLKLSLPK